MNNQKSSKTEEETTSSEISIAKQNDSQKQPKYKAFGEAFTKELAELTAADGISLNNLSDYQKCKLFDSIKNRRGFWKKVGPLINMDNGRAGSYYYVFRRKALENENLHQLSDQQHQIMQQTVPQSQNSQEQFINAFSTQLAALTQQTSNLSLSEKCNLFDSLSFKLKRGFWQKMGEILNLEDQKAKSIYQSLKKENFGGVVLEQMKLSRSLSKSSKYDQFGEAFSQILAEWTGKTVEGLSNAQKCEMYEAIEKRSGFWKKVGPLVDMDNGQAGSYYYVFKKSSLQREGKVGLDTQGARTEQKEKSEQNGADKDEIKENSTKDSGENNESDMNINDLKKAYGEENIENVVEKIVAEQNFDKIDIKQNSKQKHRKAIDCSSLANIEKNTDKENVAQEKENKKKLKEANKVQKAQKEAKKQNTETNNKETKTKTKNVKKAKESSTNEIPTENSEPEIQKIKKETPKRKVKRELFEKAFQQQLSKVTGNSQLLTNAEKCETFESLNQKEKKGFWKAVGESAGMGSKTAIGFYGEMKGREE